MARLVAMRGENRTATRRVAWRARSLALFGILLAATPLALADVACVRASLSKAVWTGETLQAVRAASDYNALLALIVTESAARTNTYRSAAALKQAIARAQQLAASATSISADPDLNPATFREMLRRLQKSRVLPEDVLNDLMRELSGASVNISEEEIILGQATAASKATFSTFMQQHVMALYDASSTALISPVLASPIGTVLLPDPRTEVGTLISRSHLPEGAVKSTLLEIANSGSVNADALNSAAKGALRTATDQFETARTTIQAIVGQQPRFDTVLLAAVPPQVQAQVAAAQRLVSSSPSQLQQFDTLRTIASLVPLPPEVSNTIRTVSQVGSAIQSTVSTVSHVASSLGSLGSVASVGLGFLTTGGIGALASSLGSVFGGGGPSNQEILDAVNRVGQQVEQLHATMVSRFDQVDRELAGINRKLDAGFAAMGAQLADIQGDLLRVVAATNSIELTLLEDRDTLQRAVINNLGFWDDNAKQILRDNLVTLLAAIDRLDAHAESLDRDKFRQLAQYFTTLARSGAASGALTGLQVAEKPDLGFAATRLSRKSALYPVNYTMSFPLGGGGGPTLQSLLSGSERVRDVTTKPYVNERVWAIAASALATMVQRWPAFANEIPGLRDAYDSVANNGRDLASLVRALQIPQALPDKPLSGPFSGALLAYKSHTNVLREMLRSVLRDEAVALARIRSFNPERTTALVNAFSAGGAQNSLDNGTRGVRANLSYVPPPLNVTGCQGEDAPNTISGNALIGWGLEYVKQALALDTGLLSGCLTVLGYTSQRNANVASHGGYEIIGHGAPCAADSLITYRTLQVAVRFMFRLPGDPDDAAHRTVIATAMAVGPETEFEGKITGQPHWSGQPTEQGHDWNSECHSARAWHVGDTNNFYIGDAAYINRNWGALLASFSKNVFVSGNFPFAQGDRSRIVSVAADQASLLLDSVYVNTVTDLQSVFHQPTPVAQSRITNVTPLVNEVLALEGIRALMQQLTTIGYERALARDDVLSGLLYGTDALPGGQEFLDVARQCNTHTRTTDLCVTYLAGLPDGRAQRLADRLALVNGDILTGKSSDSHRLLDIALDRLSMSRCLVPLNYNGRADCNAPN